MPLVFFSRFENYAASCTVQSCSYTILGHKTLTEIIIIVFGLIGGISEVLMFAVPLIIMLLFFFMQRCRRQHQQQSLVMDQIDQQSSLGKIQ